MNMIIPRTRTRPPLINSSEQPNGEDKPISAAELKLNPYLIDPARKRTFGYRESELENAIITAWISQINNECYKCGTPLRKSGKPYERPTLSYIKTLREGGTEKLENIHVTCLSCSNTID